VAENPAETSVLADVKTSPAVISSYQSFQLRVVILVRFLGEFGVGHATIVKGGLPAVSLRAIATALQCSVGGAALLLGATGAFANDDCSLSGDTIVCSGDQSQGIVGTEEHTQLYVLDLTGDISTTDVTAIAFDSEGPIAVFSDTGEYAINVAGSAGNGIVVTTYGEDTSANLEHKGNISVESGSGVIVESWAGSASTTTGTISANGDAIRVKSAISGRANVTHTGDLMSNTGYGILAIGAGSVEVSLTGNINSALDGINASSSGPEADGTVFVEAMGDITSSEGVGIHAESAFHAVEVHANGNIDGHLGGIVVIATGEDSDATAVLEQEGSITSAAGNGIYVSSAFHSARVESSGRIDVGGDGVVAISTGESSDASATVDRTGDVSSGNGSGIIATSAFHSARVESSGNVTGFVDGIAVSSTGTDDDATATIKQTGDVTGITGRGLSAKSASRNASIQSTGTIWAGGDGIQAISTGDTSDASAWVEQSGDVTSTGGNGIYVLSANAAASVQSTGAISALYDGIFVKSTGAGDDATAIVNHTGSIFSSSGYGIYAESSRQGVSVDTNGTIEADLDGIHAVSTGDSDASTVLVTHDGAVSSANGTAVYASASNEGVTVNTTGTLSGKTGGIVATSTGNSESSTVRVSHVGDISTAEGSGIYAYSSGREALVTQDGDISGGDYGIRAISESERVALTLAGGTISGASVAGVSLQSITGAALDNFGTIDGGTGYAVQSKGYGGTTISNYGTLIGDIDIDDAYSTLINQAGGLYELGLLDFTNGGALNNYGTLSPGGDGVVSTAKISGDFTQGNDGKILVDIDNTSSDLIEVSGTASLTGALQLNFIDVSDLSLTRTVLTSSGLTAADLDLIAGIAVFSSSIDYIDGTDVAVKVDLAFAPEGLSRNGSEIASALNSAYQSTDGGGELGPTLAGLANLQTIEEYETALAQLSPEVYSENAKATRTTVGTFADRLLSCRVQDGAYAFNAEGECVWFNLGATRFDQQATSDTLAYDETSATYSFGAQKAIDADWRLGTGFGYTQSEGQNSEGATNSRGQIQAGAVLKYDHEATVLAASLTAGLVTSQTERSVSFGGFTDEITGHSPAAFLSGRLHASYTQDLGGVYIKPLAELNLMQLETAAYTETGGPSALSVMGSSQTSVSLDPALEVGTQLPLQEGVVIRPYFRAGLSGIIGTDQEMVAAFVHGDGTTFTVQSETDPVLGKLAFGADILGLGNTTLRLYYDGSFGATSTQQGAGFKFSSNF
jgi:uncharacterized protein with beta-barrel porin domain